MLWGECVPLQAGELPYAPLVAALRGRGAETGVALAGYSPSCATATRTSPRPRRRRRGCSSCCSGALGRLAETTPTVLVIEDIHWADHATQDLLRFLARNLREERLLLLARCGPTRRPRRVCVRCWPSSQRSARVERVELTRLTAEDTALQVAGIVGADAGRRARRVGPRAGGGQPVLRRGAARRARRRRARRRAPRLAARRAAHPHGGRSTGLRARCCSSSPPPGRDIGHELLARAAGLDAATLGAALRELVAAHVLVCDAAAERYRFRHALAREAVYAELLPPERRALHAAIARALEEAAPRAGPRRRRVGGARPALGGRARRGSGAALPRSRRPRRPTPSPRSRRRAAQLDRARALWDRVAPEARPLDLDEVELLRRLADATRFAGDREAAIPIAEAALALVDPGAEPGRAASIHDAARDPAPLRASAPCSSSSARSSCCLPGASPQRAAAMLLDRPCSVVYGELPERDARVRAGGACRWPARRERATRRAS